MDLEIDGLAVMFGRKHMGGSKSILASKHLKCIVNIQDPINWCHRTSSSATFNAHIWTINLAMDAIQWLTLITPS